MQYTDRINKLCELYDTLNDRDPVRSGEYIAYRNDEYYSFEKEDSITITRSRFGTIEFTTQNPSEIHAEIESLLKYFEESHNLFVQK